MSKSLREPIASPATSDAEELQYFKKDFWSTENLKFSRPGCRLQKITKLIAGIADGKETCDLLDVGCGPATLMSILPPNVTYHGIDIAIQNPAPNLIERDLLEAPIDFEDKVFDIVVASGVFEYFGDRQREKFAEVARILRPTGAFIVTYTNFGHRSKGAYWALNNIGSLNGFRTDLSREFEICRSFPVGHNWTLREPNRRLVKDLNMRINSNIPIVSRFLAVEYFFVCTPR